MSSRNRGAGDFTLSSERVSQQAFLGVSALLFAASAAVTIAWCASIPATDAMPMPGASTTTHPHALGATGAAPPPRSRLGPVIAATLGMALVGALGGGAWVMRGRLAGNGATTTLAPAASPAAGPSLPALAVASTPPPLVAPPAASSATVPPLLPDAAASASARPPVRAPAWVPPPRAAAPAAPPPRATTFAPVSP